jgi:hypothetical protein
MGVFTPRNGKFKVSQLKTSGVTTSSFHTLGSVSSAAPRASGHYSYAVIDSLKLTVKTVRLSKTSDEVEEIYTPDGGKVIEIGNGETISIEEDLVIPAGQYIGGSVIFKNGYSIKAYCVTNGYLVYSTATEAKRVAYTAGMELPSDYASMTYNFGYISTATSLSDLSGVFHEGSRADITIPANEQIQVKILLDHTYFVGCYDGASASLSHSSDSFAPFTWTGISGLTTNDFFPMNKPNFGLSYVPLFVWAGPVSATEPTAKTYISSALLTSVNDTSNIGYGKVSGVVTQVHTALFNAAGDCLDMRTRNFDNSYLSQTYDFWSTSGTTHNSTNGEQVSMSADIISDRKFAFTDASIGQVTSAQITNGPQCGINFTDPHRPEWGIRDRACLTSPIDLYWVRIERA